jgi:polyhydroxyalkanoate synthase subunit PhaC
MAVPISPDDLRRRLERDVGRAIRRGRNGLRYAAGTSPPQVGRSPKDLIWERDKARLWRYRNDSVEYRQPLLIVFSLVSRPYLLDLHPTNSAVRALGARGLDVMLLEWGVADAVEAENTLETYVDGYLPEAVRAAAAAAGSDDVTLLGYCLGGVLALLSVARHPEMDVRGLVAMATPADFTALPQAMMRPLREGRIKPDDVIDETGNVPPEVIANSFRLMRPTMDLTQYATLWENLWNDEFVAGYQAMSQWAHDHVPLVGGAFRQLAQQFVIDNALVEGRVELGGEPVDLKRVTCPFLNVMAKHDNIVPAASTRPLTALVGSTDVEELCLDAGHVGLAASRTAAKVALPRIADWVIRHSDRLEG